MSQDSTITTLDTAPEVQTARPVGRPPKAAASESKPAPGGKMKTITIHPSDADGGNEDVFLAINGYAYQIKRGVPVKLPDYAANELARLQYTKYKTVGKEVVEYNVPRYAVTMAD